MKKKKQKSNSKDNIHSKIGKRISKWRKKNHRTQTEMSRIADIGQTVISRMESGKYHISVKYLYSLGITGADVHYLVTGNYLSNRLYDYEEAGTNHLSTYESQLYKKIQDLVKELELLKSHKKRLRQDRTILERKNKILNQEIEMLRENNAYLEKRLDRTLDNDPMFRI